MITDFTTVLQIYRCRTWSQIFVVTDTVGEPIDLTDDGLGLIVIPSPPRGSGKATVLEDWDGVLIQPNQVSFNVPDTATEALIAHKPYNWQLLRVSGSGAQTSVLVGGPLLVLDSPEIYEVSP
jgi:hypothetical protein